LIIHTIESLNSNLAKAGEHREQVWEKGWEENLNEFSKSKSLESLKPKYFAKIPQIRWRQNWITPIDPNMEYAIFELLLDHLFEKYVTDATSIYEFGCGTGHNLLHIREYNQSADITGLDWARSSQELIGKIAELTNDKKLSGKHFDYFKPDRTFALLPNSVVCTVASLEQTGDQFTEFIDYLMENKPKLVLHIEPIGEVLDESKLLDFLSLKYFRKRNYLNGLVTYVQTLESKGLVEVMELSRTHVGSFFIEGYTVFVWRPIQSQGN